MIKEKAIQKEDRGAPGSVNRELYDLLDSKTLTRKMSAKDRKIMHDLLYKARTLGFNEGYRSGKKHG